MTPATDIRLFTPWAAKTSPGREVLPKSAPRGSGAYERRPVDQGISGTATETCSLTLLIAAVVLCAPALAQTDPRRDVLEEIVRCADTLDVSARLSCFESAAERARSALSAAAPNEAAPLPNLRDGFGLAQPAAPVTRPEQFGKPPAPTEQLRSISATVVEFARTPRGKALFILDNGQVWRQLDADSTDLYYPPGRSLKATIERGALGSYNLSVEGRNASLKVIRLK
ncbi:MAG: hypothetical protein ACK5TK_12680 [Betaproteobacteria bacterium]